MKAVTSSLHSLDQLRYSVQLIEEVSGLEQCAVDVTLPRIGGRFWAKHMMGSANVEDTKDYSVKGLLAGFAKVRECLAQSSHCNMHHFVNFADLTTCRLYNALCPSCFALPSTD